MAHKCFDLSALQSIQSDRQDVRAHGPWRHEFGPIRQQVDQRCGRRLVDVEPYQLQGRGIGPVQVLENLQHGLGVREIQ